MMLTLVLAMLVPLQSGASERPPAPSDAELLAAVRAERPDARILSQRFEGAAGTGGRRLCGLIEIGGTVEPVAVQSDWKENSVTVTFNGVTTPPRPPEWKISVSAPRHADLGEDGVVDWTDRNLDILERRTATRRCPALTAPEGVVWAMELEADPDPVRGERNQRRAAAVTDAIFGDRAAPAPTPAPATRP